MKNSYVEQFIELLNKKGIVRQMQVAKQLTPEVATGEVQKAIDQMCVANTITKTLARDAELKSAYDNAANELMIGKIMDQLDLKKDENFKFTPEEMLAKTISEAFLGDVMKNLKGLF